MYSGKNIYKNRKLNLSITTNSHQVVFSDYNCDEFIRTIDITSFKNGLNYENKILFSAFLIMVFHFLVFVIMILFQFNFNEPLNRNVIISAIALITIPILFSFLSRFSRGNLIIDDESVFKLKMSKQEFEHISKLILKSIHNDLYGKTTV